MALAAGAFAQSVTVVFRGAALALLAAGQEPPPGQRHLAKQVAAFPLYDLDRLFAEGRLPDARHEPALPIAAASAAEISALIADADHVVVF